MDKYNVEELKKYIFEDKLPYETIGKIYGVSGTAIKKYLSKKGVTLPYKRKINPKETFGKGVIKNPIGKCAQCGKEFVIHSNGGKKYCSLKCFAKHLHDKTYEMIKNR